MQTERRNHFPLAYGPDLTISTSTYQSISYSVPDERIYEHPQPNNTPSSSFNLPYAEHRLVPEGTVKLQVNTAGEESFHEDKKELLEKYVFLSIRRTS